MGLMDGVKDRIENKKNSWKKSVEKDSVMLMRDIKDEFFESGIIMKGNASRVEKEIKEATKGLNQKFQHEFSPEVTALLWLEIIEGNDKHLNHMLDVVGYSYPDQHQVRKIGLKWNDLNHLRKFFNARVYLREINTYEVAIRIIEDFNLKELEYDEHLDEDDIEAMALFMELPEFAARFAEEDSDSRKKDAEKLEKKIDSWVKEREKKSREKVERAENSRKQAKEKLEKGLMTLTAKRGRASETEVKKVLEEFERDLDDWSVDQPFSHDKFKELVGEKY